MKKLVFIPLVIFFSLIKAQTYKPFDIKNTQWDVFICKNVGGPSNNPNIDYNDTKYIICNDTIVFNTKSYRSIYIQQHLYTNYSMVNSTSSLSLYGYFRQDSVLKRSYLKLPSWANDSLLLDYNLQLGDTIKRGLYYQASTSFSNCNAVWVIKKIKLKTFGTIIAKCFYTDTVGSGGSNTYFIEGAGHNNGIFINPFYGETYCKIFNYCSNMGNINMLSNCMGIINRVSTVTNESFKLTIYPKPANEVINVELGMLASTGSATNYKIEITDALGEVLLNQIATTNYITININNFNSGIYFVNLYTGKALVKSEKLIIIK